MRLNTGWFSDRSACYLAAGRPVVTQQTGFTRLYGGKRGLLAFQTMEEAAEAVRQINADYAAHCRAADEIAREVFEAERVLPRCWNASAFETGRDLHAFGTQDVLHALRKDD